MAEELFIVAARAECGGADESDAKGACLTFENRTHIEHSLPIRRRSVHGLQHFRSDFVAGTADRRTKVHHCSRRRKSHSLERGQPSLQDVRCRAAPTRMQYSRRSVWMSNEDRRAIGNRNGHRCTRRRGDMAIDPRQAKPPTPLTIVHDDFRSMHLMGAGESIDAMLAQRCLQRSPSIEDAAHALVGSKPE